MLRVRFLVISNELPSLADASGALASRFIVLRLINSFYGREDQRLTERLSRGIARDAELGDRRAGSAARARLLHTTRQRRRCRSGA